MKMNYEEKINVLNEVFGLFWDLTMNAFYHFGFSWGSFHIYKFYVVE